MHASGQALPEARIGPVVDSILEAAAGDDGPGLGVVVVRDGRTVFEGGRGLASVEHGVPIGPDTRFHLYSGSKQFTAFGVTLLEAEGRLSLDDEVRDHLPDFPDFGVPVTLRHLLHHTSGIRQHTTLHSYTVPNDVEVLDQARALQLIWNQRDLNFPPGTKFGYSDSGYVVLARIIEQVTGTPFPEWMAESVFQPLGMDRTLVVTDFRTVVLDLALPYAPTPDGLERGMAMLTTFYGGTGVYSTPRDLGRWLGFLASDEAGPMISRMEEPGVLVGGDTLGWGRGLILDELPDGVRRVWHGGDGHGYKMWIGRYPDLGLGIAVLSNSEARGAGTIAHAIAEALDVRARDGDEPSSPTEDLVTLSPALLEAYAGVYRLEGPTELQTFERWTTRQENGTLVLDPNGRGSVPLVALDDTLFGFPGIPVTLAFHRRQGHAGDSVTVADPTGSWSGVRLGASGYVADPAALRELEGAYYSRELDTAWGLEVRDGVPTMVHLEAADHRRRSPIPLVSVARDRLMSRSNRFWVVDVVRDESGAVTHLLVGSSWGKLSGLRFDRVRD